MRKFFSTLFKKIAEMLDNTDHKTLSLQVSSQKMHEFIESESQSISPAKEEDQEIIVDDEALLPKVIQFTKKSVQKKKPELINYPDIPLRDIIDLMEFPFLALSKDRINPIIYENEDKTQKVEISGHRGHFIASIYDWDIILVVAGKIQEILNNSSDIPPKKITIPRHELLKALHKQDGKKQQKDLEKSLDRLKLTGINTTVNNKDFRHRAGFGFIDRWGYLERKNSREMKVVHVTLSDWLYELCCAQGSLLKANKSYFELTSGLKRFLYRTARKHAGKDEWGFTIKKLYEKSGSEGSFRLFKSKLKKVIKENDIPEYSIELIEKNGKDRVFFKKSNIHELDMLAEKFEKNQEKLIKFKELG